MLSGVGPAGQLSSLGIPVVQDMPGVGQNLRDHPKVYVTWEINKGYPLEAITALGGACICCTAPGSDWRNDISINIGAFSSERVLWSEATHRSQDSARAAPRRT